MHLNSIYIQHFKSIEDLSFCPGRHAVLVGANNAGKSSILQALRLPMGLLSKLPPSSDSLDLVTDRQANVIPTITVRVSFNADDLLAIHPVFRKGDVVQFKFVFDVGIGTNSSVLLRSIEHESNDRLTTVVNCRYQANQTIGQFLQEDGSVTTTNNSTSHFLEQIRTDYTVSARMICFDPVRYLLSKMFFYDPQRSIAPKVNIEGGGTLEPSGSSLARQLMYWRLNEDPRLNEYCQLIEALIPGLGTLVTPVPPGTATTYLGFRRGKTILNVTSMGTGVQQILVLAYQLIAKEAAILALEEPESNLHPSAQRVLAQVIRKAAEDSQIILATHSPLFVDRYAYSNNWVVELDERFRSHVRPLRSPDQFQPIRDALGISIGDSLFASDTVLVVEGPTEYFGIPLLTSLARDHDLPFIDLNHVMLVNAGGIGNIKSVLKLLQGYRGVKVFVLVDESKHSRQLLGQCINDGLVENDRVTFISPSESDLSGNGGEAEFEDTLPLDIYVQSLGERYGTKLTVPEYHGVFEVLRWERQGNRPPRTHVCKRLLCQEGLLAANEDYDKVGVSLATIQKLDSTGIPTVYLTIAEKIRNFLLHV